MIRVSRRRFLALTTLSLAVCAASAQPRRPWKVGLLKPVSTDPHYWNALKLRLAELGHVEGRDVVYVARSAEGNFARLPVLALRATEVIE